MTASLSVLVSPSQMKHNPDIVCSFMCYLSAQEISRSLAVCRSWHSACDFTFFRRLLRDTRSSSDYGKGRSVRVLAISVCCCAHSRSPALQLEGWRQITLIFDGHEDRERFVAPQISDLAFLRQLVRGAESRDLG